MRFEALQQELAAARAEIERLRQEGTPGVMHEVDRAFYKLTVQQRDAAWRELAAAHRAPCDHPDVWR